MLIPDLFPRCTIGKPINNPVLSQLFLKGEGGGVYRWKIKQTHDAEGFLGADLMINQHLIHQSMA